MLKFLSFVVTCVLVHVGNGQMSCPGNAQQRVMGCARLLQGFGQASSLSEQQQHCGDARRGFACLRDVVEECEGIEGTPMGQMVNSFKQMEGQIKAVCSAPPPTESVPVPNRVSTCSRKDKRKLQKCARRMQRYAAETPVRCSKVRRAMECMTTLMEKCNSVIKPRLFSRVSRLRQTLSKICVETNEVVDESEEVDNVGEITTTEAPEVVDNVGEITTTEAPEVVDNVGEITTTEAKEVVDNVGEITMTEAPEVVDNVGEITTTEAPEESSCPDDYATALQRCVGDLNQQMGEIMGNGDVSTNQCQEIYANFDCVNNLFSTCSNMPGVLGMSTGFDEGQIPGYIAGFCPAGGSETNTETVVEGTSNATDTNTGTEPEGDEGDAGDAGCPARHTLKLQDCMRPMQGIGPGHSQNIGEMCRIMNTGFDCVQDIIDRCPDQPDVEAVTSMMNLDQMRAMVESQCSGGPMPTPKPGGKPSSNCPSGYAQKLTDCVEPMQNLGRTSPQNIAQACRAAQEGFECLDTIMTSCSGEPEVQAITSMLNIEEIRTLVDSECSKVNPIGCDISSPADELQRCNGLLRSFQSDSDSMQEECRTLFDGFDCFRKLIRSCPNDPTVTAFTSAVDIEDARESMSAYCPSRK